MTVRPFAVILMTRDFWGLLFPGGDYDIDKLKEYVEEAAAKICAAVAGVCKEHGFDLQDAAASKMQAVARERRGERRRLAAQARCQPWARAGQPGGGSRNLLWYGGGMLQVACSACHPFSMSNLPRLSGTNGMLLRRILVRLTRIYLLP